VPPGAARTPPPHPSLRLWPPPNMLNQERHWEVIILRVIGVRVFNSLFLSLSRSVHEINWLKFSLNCNCNCNWGTCIAPPTRWPRAHHRVNPYLGACRQNETEMFSDHDETSPLIAAVSAPSVACSISLLDIYVNSNVSWLFAVVCWLYGVARACGSISWRPDTNHRLNWLTDWLRRYWLNSERLH